MTYILANSHLDYVVLIDCGNYEELYKILIKLDKKVKAVLLTHGHSDHIYGLQSLLVKYPEILVYSNDVGFEELRNSKKNLSFYNGMPFVIDNFIPIEIYGGDVLHFEGLCDIKVIDSPGHDSSCLSYLSGNNLFTGDAYIPGLEVYTKFPRGNKTAALETQKKLKLFEKNGCHVYCGHYGYEDLIK